MTVGMNHPLYQTELPSNVAAGVGFEPTGGLEAHRSRACCHTVRRPGSVHNNPYDLAHLRTALSLTPRSLPICTMLCVSISSASSSLLGLSALRRDFDKQGRHILVLDRLPTGDPQPEHGWPLRTAFLWYEVPAFLSFRPAKVGVCELQFGHNNLRFSSRLSSGMPLI